MKNSLIRKIFQYQKERFPFVVNSVFILLYYFGFQNLIIFRTNQQFIFNIEQLAGYISIFLVFLELRLIDEIKDFKTDSLYAKERPVQRGIITLGEIKLTISFLLLFLFSLNIFLGLKEFIGFLTIQIFIFIMFKEFFIGEKIKRNRLIYASLHMIVMVIFIFYISIFAGVSPFIKNNLIIYALSYLSGFIIEIGRKIEAPINEKEGVDNYSKLLGPKGASILLLSLSLIYSIISIMNIIKKNILFIIPLVLILLIVLITGFIFVISLTPKSQKNMSLSTQVLLMISFILFIILPSRG